MNRKHKSERILQTTDKGTRAPSYGNQICIAYRSLEEYSCNSQCTLSAQIFVTMNTERRVG